MINKDSILLFFSKQSKKKECYNNVKKYFKTIQKKEFYSKVKNSDKMWFFMIHFH